MDGWINLNMEPDVAARICALRPSVEDLIINGVANPEAITEPRHQDEQVMLTFLYTVFSVKATRHIIYKS